MYWGHWHSTGVHWRALESWQCWGLLGALEVLDSAGGSGVSWELWGLLEIPGGYWGATGTNVEYWHVLGTLGVLELLGSTVVYCGH